MKKSDLKFGNVVETRNQNRYLCYKEDEVITLYNLKCYGYISLGSLNENLKCYHNEEYDVVKVYEDYTLKNLLWERKEPLLTNEEKEWLSAVIKPFRDKVECVVLEKSGNKEKIGYLAIRLQNNDEFFSPYISNLPFKFKGLEFDKAYTLDDLGLQGDK